MPDLSSPAELPALRDGLLERDPPRLLGSLCPACGMRMFPARGFCPACDSEAAPEVVTLAPTGRVFSFTTVRQAPGHRPVPYTLAYVDLDDGVRVLAQLDAPAGASAVEPRIGQRVGLVLRNVVPPPGEPRLGYAFAPLADDGSDETGDDTPVDAAAFAGLATPWQEAA
jgi:uncharacterized OB-fold protein